MEHLPKGSTIALITALFSLSMVWNVVGQPIMEKKKKESEQPYRSLKHEMVHVKGGCFEMGDTFGDGLSDEKPVHTACVDDFDIGKYEVTQGQWLAVMNNSPSGFSSCGDECPVEGVSWDDAQDFIRELNAKTGKNYRLPTEDEWEYAARSGGKSEKWSGTSNERELGEYAWYKDNSGGSPHPVGKKRPNGLGIHDMSGNVWEWVQDIYRHAADTAKSKDNRKHTGSVSRGGGWKGTPMDVRTSNRFYAHPAHRYSNQGFRLAVTR